MIDEQRALFVALVRGPFRRHLMELRQRLIEGTSLTDIAADHIDGLDTVEAASLIGQWEGAGERLLTWLDDDYPNQLRDVHDFPPVIFVRGQLRQNDRGVAVVGSRSIDQGGASAADAISDLLVERSLTVVSGLAEGTDTVAHQAALDTGGRTVAVIGTGIDRTYPAKNRALKMAIEKSGLVLSQFWPGEAGRRYTFPMRNAVMSAYALATIIVTATEESGSRHQARQAISHGRPLVLSASVATGTSWGRRYAQDEAAMVRVAGSPEEAVTAALEMIGELSGSLG
ncbi:DNA-processing protein DprA [Propionibacterium freudenreichii]|uniref:DNA-processing protein DprA n=1 Tax=Propionibacterium freudenreichii TaxID=1744 RepID=UPI0005A5CF17|nr:DNA-processing protein DprA [Propionibacterium freudenreichii]MDK9346739.1 DNA-protecting protein DprA [Propionibacterium freudenreichii]MDK9591978.1 DNA-processing protein DprA [Propionibacterium freudenreichii]MDK9675757.1 DNA-protecting protein DprA [Propionibacterium freudenreichii]WFF34912.1 DNA-processing protein DprA [Propionibacterium freudenreichii]WFF37141.1 DNA-processing protein DprA [Propionibacterium freudenreichii]